MPPHCCHLPPICHVPARVFLSASCLSPMGMSSSCGEMWDMLLLRGEGLPCAVAKGEGTLVSGARQRGD